MDRLAPGLVAALSWNPQVKGALYTLIAMVILPGSAYLLLSTNVGARLGFQLAAAGFCGWMVLMGLVWWVYGIGLTGPAPEWKPRTVVTGNPAERGTMPELDGYPRGWKNLPLEDPEVADAQAVVDGVLVPSPESGRQGRFSSASDYLTIAAREKGGETYGPLGLNFRPFDVFHKAHFLIIQVQQALKLPAVPGQPPPRTVPDPAAQPVAVVMVRDLGAVRLYPALVTLGFGTLLLLLVWSLHHRDKEAFARQAQKVGS